MKLRLLLRQATSSVGASIAIALIVAVAAGLFTAWPRLSRATFEDEVAFRSEQTSATARALTGRSTGAWPVSTFDEESTYEAGVGVLDDVAASAGPALRPLLGEPEMLITVGSTNRPVTGSAMSFDGPTPRPSDLADRLLLVRAIDSVTDHVDIVQGRAPQAWQPPTYDDDFLFVAPPDPIEVMISTATAERLGITLGDELTGWGPRLFDASSDGAVAPPTLVTGLFEATDPDESYWQFQLGALDARIASDPNVGDLGIGAAYMHPDTATQIASSDGITPTTDVWIPVAAGGDDPAAVLDDLRDLTAREITLGNPDIGGAQLQLDTALIDVLSGAIAAQRGTSAVLTLVAAGPVGVTFALLALTTRLSVSRRRDTLALASARGGSPAQIRGALGVEGLVLALPAAALGALVGTLLVPGVVQVGDYLLALLAGLAPAVFLAGAALPNLRTQRHDLTCRSASPWRWVVEVLVVGAAAAAGYLLLTRGLQATTTRSVDPLATATPLLISLAAAVLATRLFPYPMRVVHALARRRRDLPAFLGSARAIREAGAGLVPMLALVVATSIAMFSTTMLTTLTGGVDESSRATNGADVRLVGPPYPDETVEQIAGIDGVAQVARIFSQPQTAYTVGPTTRQVTLYAVDTTALGDVQNDVSDAVGLPPGMDTLVDGAVPVVVSGPLMPETDEPATIRMSSLVPVTVVATASSAAGIADSALWAVVDLDLLRETTGQNLVPRMLLVDLSPDADVDATVARISDAVGGVGTIESVEAEQAGFLASPSATSMQQGFVVALVLSLLQCVLALVLTLVLAAPARGRLVAVLRTLGTSARDARRLVTWELVPLAAVALVIGTALGLALPHLVVATVDLSVFTGQASPAVVYDWPRLALVLAGVIAVIGLTLLVASTLARRFSLSVLRIGDQQ